MIDKFECKKRLDKDEYFEIFEKQYEYRYPVVEYFINNHFKPIVNGIEYDIKLLKSNTKKAKQLTILAFNQIKTNNYDLLLK